MHNPPLPPTLFPRHRFFHIAFAAFGSLWAVAGIVFCFVDEFWIGERLTYGPLIAFSGVGCAVANLVVLIRNRPVIVVDYTGLTVRPGGFIPWHEIAGVRIGHQQFQEMLEIWLYPYPATAAGSPRRRWRRATAWSRARFPHTITHLALHPYTPDDVIHAMCEYNLNLTVFPQIPPEYRGWPHRYNHRQFDRPPTHRPDQQSS